MRENNILQKLKGTVKMKYIYNQGFSIKGYSVLLFTLFTFKNRLLMFS